MKNISDKVKQYIKKYRMIEKDDKVIAGISGGADSVCLFFVLLELREELGNSFVAVHVNHGLRGADADADEQFVRRLCRKYSVPMENFQINLELIAGKRKQSLEEAGRDVRREIFTRVMSEHKGSRIALAHHQNDNAETLLWNLARGTGLHGLGGIRPVNGVWIRPLLVLTRQEIEAYLKERGQDYRTDITNLETAYTRNKLRHQVLPLLEKEVNSAAVRHMNETMEQIWELQEFVRQETEKAAESCVMQEKEGCLINTSEWRKLPVFLQKEVLYGCLEKSGGTKKNIGRPHVKALQELFDRQVGRTQDFPGDLRAIREYDGIRLEKRCGEDKEQAKGYDIEEDSLGKSVQIPGVTWIPEMRIKLSCKLLENEAGWKAAEIPQKKYTKWFDYDIIKRLSVRTRRSGDFLVIDREGHRQKFKSWCVNEKIPAKERSRIPLLTDGQQIIWVIGRRMSSAYQVREDTKRVLQIEIEEMNPEKEKGNLEKD